ncbi:MAG: heavy metal translocating P-type ATPase, partial [Jatrophihabitans sp.]
MPATGSPQTRSRAAGLLDGARPWVEPLLLVLTLVALAAGAVAWLAGNLDLADACWIAGTIAGLVPAIGWVLSALMHKRTGVDLIAVLALAGTLVVSEFVAGALIAVMLASGRALDAAAERRASSDLRALLERAPRTARRRIGTRVAEIPLEDVLVGDLLIVGPGEVVPVDGVVEASPAVLDESALTGEADPIERAIGEQIRSGVLNAGSAFELRAGNTPADSTYAGIIAMVQQASAQSAPVIRLADRYATWFLPLSLLTAGSAWLISGSMVRAVAVLVVATPCPLLLAAPVAIVSGLSRASRIGVVIRSGVALESLGRAQTMVIDKTGTLTAGHPVVIEIAAAPGWDAAEVLRLAATADQLSPHVLAEAIVAEAHARQLPLSLPTDVSELPGRGVAATVEGLNVEVGKHVLGSDAPVWARAVLSRATLDGSTVTWLTVCGALVGAVLLRDPLRPDANRTVRRLRAAGLRRLVMLTGDRAEPAQEIGTALGLDEVRAEQTPASKLAAVRAEGEAAVTVMVGDGINDAPALAAATVGVAMGARGATASSEAADIVLTTDRLDRLADAMDIARRARHIAVQSAVAGMAMSLV